MNSLETCQPGRCGLGGHAGSTREKGGLVLEPLLDKPLDFRLALFGAGSVGVPKPWGELATLRDTETRTSHPHVRKHLKNHPAFQTLMRRTFERTKAQLVWPSGAVRLRSLTNTIRNMLRNTNNSLPTTNTQDINRSKFPTNPNFKIYIFFCIALACHSNLSFTLPQTCDNCLIFYWKILRHIIFCEK